MEEVVEQRNQFLTPGTKYGMLTIISTEVIELTLHPDVINVICSCECGNVSRTTATSLISGIVTNCGCIPAFAATLDETEGTKAIRTLIGCNAGIALSYLRSGMSNEEIFKKHKKFRNTYHKSIIRFHFVPTGNTVTGWVNNRYFELHEHECECGCIVYMRPRIGRPGMCHHRCQCDLYDPVFNREAKNKRPIIRNLNFTKFKNEVSFNKEKCRISNYGPGLCIHYCGDEGCLTDLANDKLPKRFKKDHSCFESEDDRKATRPDSRYSSLFGNMNL